MLSLTVEGLTHAQIGERLMISARTAEHHRESMMRRLGLCNHTELVRFALRRGIIDLDDPE